MVFSLFKSRMCEHGDHSKTTTPRPFGGGGHGAVPNELQSSSFMVGAWPQSEPTTRSTLQVWAKKRPVVTYGWIHSTDTSGRWVDRIVHLY